MTASPIEPRATVSILTYTALRQAKACIASVLRSTLPFKLILTANGNPEAAKYFTELSTEFPFIRVVINPVNMGFIEPNKMALDMCDTEFLIFLNDDAIVPPDWIAKLIEPLDLYKTGAVSGAKGGCQSLHPNFHGFKGPNFEYIEFSCAMVRVATMRKHGLFDPQLKFCYGEDSSTCLRMRELGYTLHLANFSIQHEVGATSRNVPEVRRYQAENHAYLIKRWAHYLKCRCFGNPILVKRNAAHGDVLLTTPIVRRLRELNPLSDIYVETLTPAIYANNPWVRRVDRRINILPNMQIIDLNGAYEKAPDKPIVEAYAERAGLPLPMPPTELYLSDADRAYALRTMPDDTGTWAAVHAGPNTWKSKEWANARWTELIARLRAAGFKIVLVGHSGAQQEGHADMRGRTTIQEMAALIERAKVFIGIDSLPLHCAEAAGTPTVGLFGVTDPRYILTHPERASPVCGTSPSFGLRHRVKHSNSVDDGGAAMASITVDMVCAAIDNFNIPGISPCLGT